MIASDVLRSLKKQNMRLKIILAVTNIIWLGVLAAIIICAV